jgi:phosphatidylserine/phosphatidylglycerophosphate/cardiolipin synthase-like enzyme
LSVVILASCAQVPEEFGPPIEVHFCPREDCAQLLTSFINGSADCALYDVSLPGVKDPLSDVRVVTDQRNRQKLPGAKAPVRPRLMHNKFCVKGDAILTGSYNPTKSDLHNNIVIIGSPSLAGVFQDEFDELWSEAPDRRVRHPVIRYNGRDIGVSFCPEDGCERHVLDALSRANTSIRFALYSFTSDAIGDVLVAKHRAGVRVSGAFGTRNRWDEFGKLEDVGINVVFNSSIHDKVFIIDNRTVITGSYNPTGNGDGRNDENVLILNDEAVAGRFVEEFSS